MGHESTSMDDRYTMIGDEDLRDAKEKMKTLSLKLKPTKSADGNKPDLVEQIETLKAQLRLLEASVKEFPRFPVYPRDAPIAPHFSYKIRYKHPRNRGGRLQIVAVSFLLVRMKGLEPSLPCEN
jgi:hypothetical protein